MLCSGACGAKAAPEVLNGRKWKKMTRLVKGYDMHLKTSIELIF
jgi:hypothetical protein